MEGVAEGGDAADYGEEDAGDVVGVDGAEVEGLLELVGKDRRELGGKDEDGREYDRTSDGCKNEPHG